MKNAHTAAGLLCCLAEQYASPKGSFGYGAIRVGGRGRDADSGRREKIF